MDKQLKMNRLIKGILSQMIDNDTRISGFILNYDAEVIEGNAYLKFDLNEAIDQLELNIVYLRNNVFDILRKLINFQKNQIFVEYRCNGEIVEFPTAYDLSIQEGYFYYPGSDFDFSPMKYLISNSGIRRFVYCDYSHYGQFEQGEQLVTNQFELINTEEIGPEFVNGNFDSWDDFWHPETPANFGNSAISSARKFNFRCHGDDRIFELIYFKTEAISTYELLCENWGAPTVMHLQDHSLGWYWTDFGGGDSVFYLLAHDLNKFPKFLLNSADTVAWPGYESLVTNFGEFYYSDGQGIRKELYVRHNMD